MKKCLFIDDFRIPQDAFNYTWNSDYLKLKWDIVRSYDEYVKYIEKNGMPDMISFDHDLADEHYTPPEYWDNYEKSKEYQEKQVYMEKTGFDCAKWLVDYCMDNKVSLPLILIHSKNTVGADNIKNLFLNYIKFTEQNDQEGN